MIMNITGPTETERNMPSPNPAMKDVNMLLDEIDVSRASLYLAAGTRGKLLKFPIAQTFFGH